MQFSPAADRRTKIEGACDINLKSKLGWGAAVALIAACTASATPTNAVPNYDGIWSVSIVTTRGDCIASYRYPIRITNGVVGNGGNTSLSVSGRVASNGAVTVNVSKGDKRAAGSGRLSGSLWHGSWRGAAARAPGPPNVAANPQSKSDTPTPSPAKRGRVRAGGRSPFSGGSRRTVFFGGGTPLLLCWLKKRVKVGP